MQNKKIAIVTGATGGLGKEFVNLMLKEGMDEIWCVARNKDKLNALQTQVGTKIVQLVLDLSDIKNIANISDKLVNEKPSIAYLINNAGVGEVLGTYIEGDFLQCSNTVALNCSAIAALCNVCIPYMGKGDRIINLSSQSSFQPVPYINLYAATKAFVTSYTRGLNVELKNKGISATAVCAGWTDTEMLPKTKNNITIKYNGIVSPQKVAIKAINDAKKGKDVSVCTLYVKWMRLLSKVFPHKLVMKTWVKSINKYL